MRLLVKVVPGSSRDVITGWLGEALKVRVQAPAERGKANASVERLVAKTLGIPMASVRIVAGGASARKTLEIIDLSETDVYRRLSKPSA